MKIWRPRVVGLLLCLLSATASAGSDFKLPRFDNLSWPALLELWRQNQLAYSVTLAGLVIIIGLLWLLVLKNRQLRANQHQLMETIAGQQAILSAIPELMFEMDLEGRYLNVWARHAEDLTASKSNLLNQKVTDVMPPQQASIVLKALQLAYVTGHSHGQEIHIPTPHGRKWFELSTSIKNTSDPEPHFIMLSRDITDRKQAEKSIRVLTQRYRGLFENMANGVVVYTARDEGEDFEVVDFNQGGEAIDGVRRQQVIGKRVTEAFPGVEAMGLLDVFRRVWKSGRAETLGARFYQDERSHGWRENYVYKLESGELVAIYRDVTKRKRYEKKLRLAASVFQHSQEGIIITDPQNNIIDANPACSQLTGYSRQELIGENPGLLSSGRQSGPFYQAMWASLSQHGHWQGELLNRRKNGEIYTELLSIDAVHDEQGELQYYVGVFSDISYLKEQEQALQRMAYSDALTGLPNRLLLHDRMEQAIRQAQRHDSLVAVCYLDLDGFKPVNDRYGHEAGDEVLVAVSERLQKVLRTEDTVARLGGDEFVLLVQDIKSVRELETMLDRILSQLSQPYTLSKGQPVVVTASIGIALYPLDDVDPDTLLRHADQAMYLAKKQGKNGYSYFDTGAEQQAMRHQHFYAEIERALAQDEFELYYQPKVNMRTGEVVGAEALIRWNHPDKGLLTPIEFLPKLENNPLIIELGEWVLRHALTHLQQFRARDCNLKVSINIAALHIEQINFVESVQHIIQSYPTLQPQDIEFEILESAALRDINRVSRVMRECGALGIEFALDDFGTGYSSLTYLKELPARRLKIDQSFIQDLLQEPDDVVISEGVLGMARAFGRQVIAEGVETVQHGAMLLSMGCELGQGYGIARPMPASKLVAWAKAFKTDEAWKHLRETLTPEIDITLLLMAVEHQKMVTRVINAINNRSITLLPEKLDDAEHCRLGEWLHGEGAELYRSNPVFQRLAEQHEKMHALCQLAAQQIAEGAEDVLEVTHERLNQSRHEVLDSLNQLRQQSR